MRRFMVFAAFIFGFAVVGNQPASADVSLHDLFGENMVLQRDIKVPIWGTANKGEKVTIRFLDQEHSTMAENDGKWFIDLPKMKEGGPFPMTIIATNVITLKNVMVGDVWLVAGGCNMEHPLQYTEDAQKNISISENKELRLCQIPHRPRLYPQKDWKDSPTKPNWKSCGTQSSPVFSAVGYYFGQDLQNAIKVPVGLIQVTHNGAGWTSQGTPAETWVGRHMLSAYPELKPLIDKFDADVDHYFNVSVPSHIEAIEKYTMLLKKAKAERAEFLPGQPGQPFNPGHYPHNPTTLYNGMIAPLVPFAIKGVVYFQGEANAINPWNTPSNSHLYRTLFPALIKNWRDDWDQGEFPFLFVQLGTTGLLDAAPKDSHWAELREAQLMTFNRQGSIRVANTAMAVVTDCGEPNNVLFRRKQPVGHRLALAARALVYSQKSPMSGPIFDAIEIKEDKVLVSFKHVGEGLEAAKGEPEVKGFTMAGDDGVFHVARGVIKDDKVVVTCTKVMKPRAVRYGWADHPDINLWNKDGLPAAPFRSDTFPVLSTPK